MAINMPTSAKLLSPSDSQVSIFQAPWSNPHASTDDLKYKPSVR